MLDAAPLTNVVLPPELQPKGDPLEGSFGVGTFYDLDEKTGVLVASLAVQGSKLEDAEREYAIDAILDGRLKSTDQVAGVLSALPS